MDYAMTANLAEASLQGSQAQAGRHATRQAPYEELTGKFIVVEELLDGVEVAVSFSSEAELLLWSDGQSLPVDCSDGAGSRFAQWAKRHQDALFDRLGDQYLMYGMDLHRKQTAFYDRLPHYFLETGIYDGTGATHLSSEERRRVLCGAPVLPAPVLYAGSAPPTVAELLRLIRPWSVARSPGWEQALQNEAIEAGADREQVARETWRGDGPKGLAIRVEEAGRATARYLWVCDGFPSRNVRALRNEDAQHLVSNQLVEGADLDAAKLAVTWENLPYLPQRNKLLSREEFRIRTLAKKRGACCLCGNVAVDAHHILDRKLFRDGGYYLDNGAPLCGKCHLDAERGTVSVETVRDAVGITAPVLAPGMFPDKKYDKWGKMLP